MGNSTPPHPPDLGPVLLHIVSAPVPHMINKCGLGNGHAERKLQMLCCTAPETLATIEFSKELELEKNRMDLWIDR